MATAKAKPPVKKRKAAPKVKPRRKGKKNMMTKIRPFALPVAAALAFLAPYMKKAIGDATVVGLIKTDIENFDSKEAMKRLTGAAGEIIVPGLIGTVIKETRVIGKFSSIGADLLIGLAIGTAGKAILDPPTRTRGPPQLNSGPYNYVPRNNLYEGGY